MSFADTIHAMTFQKPDIGFATVIPNIRKLHEDALLKLRMDLRSATRFVLDDDFVRAFVNQGGKLTPGKLTSRILLANAPFDVTWIEYNNDVRVEEGHRLGFNNDPDRTPTGYNGVLIKRLRGDPGEFLVTHFSSQDADNQPAIIPWSPLAWRVSCSGEMPMFNLAGPLARSIAGAVTEESKPLLGSDDELEMTDRMQAAMAWGFGTFNEQNNQWAYFLEDELKKYGGFWIDPYYYGPMIDAVIRAKTHPNQRELCRVIARMIAESCQEMRGVLRMIVTILSMINYVPIVYHAHEAKGFQRVRLRNVPYLSHKTVTIHGQKTKHLTIVEHAIESEFKRRRAAHPVRGHWRNVEWKKGRHVTACAHEPAYRDGDLAMCGKCESMIRWIDHYSTGGDGFTTHDYKVTR